MIKRFIIAFVLLVLIGGAIVGFNLFREKAISDFFATMKAPAATISTTVVKPLDWTPGIEAIGTVAAARGVDLTVETTGIVKDVLFAANEHVEEGQSLVRLDDAVQQADLAAAKTQAALDRQALDRALALQERGVGTEATLDAARAASSASASQVAKLQAVLDQKLLKAPFSGTIGIPRVEEGQYVAPGNAVATLQDIDTMRADFTVPEQRFSELKIGQPVHFGLAAGDLPYEGKVVGIDPKIDPVSRLVSVRAEITNPDGRLSPGQFVQVRVELPEEQNVLALPQTALTTSLYGDFIFVVKPAQPKQDAKPADAAAAPAAAEGEAKPAADAAKPATDAAKPVEGAKPELVLAQVFVTPGRRNAGLVEITKGIAAGDEVVTAGQNRLFNGMSVNVDNTIDPTKPANPQAAAQ